MIRIRRGPGTRRERRRFRTIGQPDAFQLQFFVAESRAFRQRWFHVPFVLGLHLMNPGWS